MSLENAKKLVTALRSDESLKQKFQNAGEGGFEALATSEGYSCTKEELQQAIRDMADELELSDEELDKVAGGAIGSVSIGI